MLVKGEGAGPYRMGPVILFVSDDACDRAEELISASEEGSLALEPGDELAIEASAN